MIIHTNLHFNCSSDNVLLFELAIKFKSFCYFPFLTACIIISDGIHLNVLA